MHNSVDSFTSLKRKHESSISDHSWLETMHDKTNKTVSASSEDFGQPGYPSSLISLYTPREESVGATHVAQ